MMRLSALLTIIFFCLLNITTHAQSNKFCSKWNSVEEIGQIPHVEINESSGIVSSKQFADRLYHINDSGDGPYFYVTDLTGQLIKKVEFNLGKVGSKPRDIEDLTIGTYKGEPAIFLADMGDNNESRPRISLYIIKELEQWPDQVELLDIVDLTYPDGSHDAESVGFSNGHIFFLTKKVDWEERRAIDAGLYSIDLSIIESRAAFDLSRVELTKRLSLNLPYLLYNYNLWGRIATAMDIHPDGSQFAILTYGAILVVNKSIDQLNGDEGNTKKWELKKDYNIIETPDTPQQEALTYSYDGNSLYFTTEYKSRFGKNPIYSYSCSEILVQ